MRKGVLEYCILSMLAQDELSPPTSSAAPQGGQKLMVVEGTLYPLSPGSRTPDCSPTAGRNRSVLRAKYYKLTVGEKFLTELDQTWEELSQAVKKTTRRNAQR